MILKLGMQHLGLELYIDYLNGVFWLTLTNLTDISNFCQIAFFDKTDFSILNTTLLYNLIKEKLLDLMRGPLIGIVSLGQYLH